MHDNLVLCFQVSCLVSSCLLIFFSSLPLLKQEAGQTKLQSRLEEDEQAKAALTGRIQRLTKLILVSTKNAVGTKISQNTVYRRRQSFGEDEVLDQHYILSSLNLKFE